ncbi:XAC2610-related protein [Sessilibacter sp. MAH2]
MLAINKCHALNVFTENHAATSGYKCELTIGDANGCTFNSENSSINLSLNLNPVGSHEQLIESISVTQESETHTLIGSPEISVFNDDILIMQYRDINFDGRLDLAVSTSFGTPNLYFDYWLNSEANGFIFLGNYPAFKIDSETQTLLSKVKINAANYEQQVWHWDNLTLIPTKQ